MKPTETYILRQPSPYREIILHIVDVVQHTIPEASLEFKWGIPYFYYKKKPFCYINASHKKHFVDLGFAKGFELQNHLNHLIADNGRNTIKSLRYTSLESMDTAVLIAVLQEAKALYQ